MNRDSFEELWKRFYPKVYVFVAGMLTGADIDADDFVQEIMLKVSRRIENYDPTFSLSTWVYTIARNHCIDVMRASRPKSTTGGANDFADHAVSHYPGPENEALSKELDTTVDRFMGTLPVRDRQIAFLRFHERLSYRSIGKIMEIPVGTLKYRVHEARKSLNEFLEKEYGLSHAIGKRN